MVKNCVGSKNQQYYSIVLGHTHKQTKMNKENEQNTKQLENHFFYLVWDVCMCIYYIYIHKKYVSISKSFAYCLHVSVADCWVKNIYKFLNATKNIWIYFFLNHKCYS